MTPVAWSQGVRLERGRDRAGALLMMAAPMIPTIRPHRSSRSDLGARVTWAMMAAFSLLAVGSAKVFQRGRWKARVV
jgi:hypothetical protein